MKKKESFHDRPIIYDYTEEICANCKWYSGGKYDMHAYCTHKKHQYPVQFNFRWCRLGKRKKFKVEEMKPVYKKVMGA